MDVVSDVHLHDGDPVTARAFFQYLGTTDADALFILGDLFEVWVGDDAPAEGVVAEALDALAAAARRLSVHIMHGNRDFLLGQAFHARLGTGPLPDPTLFDWGQGRWLLTHGDAWCLDDLDYQPFRAQVRSPQWQAAFLERPIAERQDVARQLRDASEARKRATRPTDHPTQPGQHFEGYADVDEATALHWLQSCDAQVLIHGHTHRPATHALSQGRTRVVLTDWDARSHPPRGAALRLYPNGQWAQMPI